MSKQKVIVFGATGAVGTALCEYLSREHPDWEIRAVSRRSADNNSSSGSKELPNVKMVQGDSFDRDSVLNLTADCDIIYSCIGFSTYERRYWAEHWPATVDNLLAAVTTGSANSNNKNKKLVFCDNIYAYGPAKNININSPKVPASTKSKPAIRALLHQKFDRHIKEHPGTLTVVGGSDFFGPGATDKSFLGDSFAGKIVADETPLAIGSASKIHDFCFAPDFAKAMAMASVNEAAYDRFWICPHSVHGKTMSDIANDIAAAAGKSTPVKVQVVKPWLVYLLSPFMGFMSEMKEMLLFWTNDYTVDDSDFVKAFGVEATPYQDAIASLVSFYQARDANK